MDDLDVIVVAPHPDDAELGMGGAILKMISDGLRVGVLDLTNGEPTPRGSEEIRKKETEFATEILGLQWRDNLGLPNRSLEPTLENRRILAEVFRATRPRWIFAPYWEDAHPDHLAATQLVDASRFWSKLTKSKMSGEPFHPERIYHYYSVHLKMAAQPAFVLDISHYWQKKLQSVAAYQSQFGSEPPAQNEFLGRLETQAAYWGQTIGVQYGEPFNCREPIGISGFSNLV
ncbi:MAG: bacillithiol biosynthesis deacetylase BshB1 [Planctomycetota bacterium]|nr:bacillithiol biosynthesis deacetylase BshB1 [Planctomycetota bacterium]